MQPLKKLAISLAAAGSDLWLRSPLGHQDRLRVLAYHEIRDAEGFERQMAHLVSAYRPVAVEQVIEALDGGALPPGAVWVTFDDGDPTVAELGLRILKRYGIQATMFVCPGVIDTNEPYWWQIVDRAAGYGLVHRGGIVTGETRAHLKTIPDEDRRLRVDSIRSALEDAVGSPITRPQLSHAQLEKWLAEGHRVGNHTWDHPLLDNCTTADQELQVIRAHEWLRQYSEMDSLLFAYPNGNWTEETESLLGRLGYRIAVEFDHRLGSLESPLRVSRLRVTADSDLDRFRAIVSGVHPWAHKVRKVLEAQRRSSGLHSDDYSRDPTAWD